MKYKFIWDVLVGRIAGTGINLSTTKASSIGYNNKRIWGIKKIVNDMIEYFYHEITSRLPEEESSCAPDLLDDVLFDLLVRFEIPREYLEAEFNNLKSIPSAWIGLEEDMKCAFKINAFFNAIDNSREEFAKNTLNMINNLFNPKGEVRIPNFRIKNFGFLFRAREYSKLFSQYVCNDGYSQTVKRISKVLLEEYQDVQKGLENKDIDAIQENSQDPLSKEHESLIKSLESDNIDSIIKAINEIQEKKIESMKKFLEQLLQHPNEEIQNKALDAILSFETDLIAK
jgi:ribosomal protein S17E